MWSAVEFKCSLIELITNTHHTNKKSVWVYFYDAITLSHRDKGFQDPFTVSASPLAWSGRLSQRIAELAAFKARTSGSMASENRPNALQHHKSISSNKTRAALGSHTDAFDGFPGEQFCMWDDNRSRMRRNISAVDFYAISKDWCGIDHAKSCCCFWYCETKHLCSDHKVITNNEQNVITFILPNVL